MAEVHWDGRSVILSRQIFPVFERLLEKALSRDQVASGSQVEGTTAREAKDLIRELRDAFKAAGFTDAESKALIVTVRIFLTACAEVGSDTPPSACPPVVEYTRAEQTRVAEELAALPEDTLIVGWLADYAVLRDQVRACAIRRRGAWSESWRSGKVAAILGQ